MAEDQNYRSYYHEGRNKFQSIQNKVFWQELLSHLRGRHNELMNFDEIRSRLHLHEELYQGRTGRTTRSYCGQRRTI